MVLGHIWTNVVLFFLSLPQSTSQPGRLLRGRHSRVQTQAVQRGAREALCGGEVLPAAGRGRDRPVQERQSQRYSYEFLSGATCAIFWCKLLCFIQCVLLPFSVQELIYLCCACINKCVLVECLCQWRSVRPVCVWGVFFAADTTDWSHERLHRELMSWIERVSTETMPGFPRTRTDNQSLQAIFICHFSQSMCSFSISDSYDEEVPPQHRFNMSVDVKSPMKSPW